MNQASQVNMMRVHTDEGARWFVLHARSRQEKTLACDLQAMGIGVYLPLVSEKRYHGKRKVSVDVPLFPGYVFLRGTIEQAYQADRTRRIVQIIRVMDQERISRELASLQRAMSGEARIDPCPFLTQGVPVRVRCGPLQGVEGVIEARSADNRLVLLVSMLGRAVSLEVDSSFLEVTGPPQLSAQAA